MTEDEKTPLSIQDKAKDIASKGSVILGNHRLIIVIIIVGMALAGALLKTRSFIDISRNEDRYTEEVLKINYKQIDSDIINEFKLADEDGKIEVNSNFDTNRKNPFTE